MIKDLIDFLIREQIISDAGQWFTSKSKKKTDILGFIDALEVKQYIKYDDRISIGNAFCKKFKVNLKRRSIYLNSYVRKDAKEKYLEILDDFLLGYNQKNQPKTAK